MQTSLSSPCPTEYQRPYADYSPEGRQIAALLDFLKQAEDLTQGKVVQQSKIWKKEGVIPAEELKEIQSSAELSRAMNNRSDKQKRTASKQRAKEMVALLKRMCHTYGYRIEKCVEKGKTTVLVYYTEVEPLADAVQHFNPNKQGLTAHSLMDVIDKEPTLHPDFSAALMECHEVRILQSAFYDAHDIMAKLGQALEVGKVCKVKILLAQPFSQAAKDRSHTYGDKRENQYTLFNNKVMEAISGITVLHSRYHGEKKLGYEIDIQLRLYYDTPSLPIYQCMGPQENNELLLCGVFWRKTSSFNKPHLLFRGNQGQFIRSIEDHFNATWHDVNEGRPNEFDWPKQLGQRNTFPVNPDLDTTQLFSFLRKSSQLAFFFRRSTNRAPYWCSFKAFYYNFANTPRNFLLQVNPIDGIARITNTHNGSDYEGLAVRLHDSFSLFLHSANPNGENRIITLRIPVGETKLEHKALRFAIYSNTDINSGSPYSQMMLLRKLEDINNYEQIQEEPENYTPFLEEKKISMPSHLWNKNSLREMDVRETYQLSFESRHRDKYFELLRRELTKVRNEVYFLGYAPETNAPDMDHEILHRYYDLHWELLSERKIRVHRILLDPVGANGSFKAYMESLMESKNAEQDLRFYASKRRIPILNDLILIDPKSKNSHTAILSFLHRRKINSGSTPIRLEVIKQDTGIVQNLLDTCLEFMTMEGVKRYKSIAEFEEDQKS